MRTVTLKQTGYMVGGTATIGLWGGGEGRIQMDRTFVSLGKLTKDNLHRCINDGQFGCEAILHAQVFIWDHFENGYEEFNREIPVNRPQSALVCRGV